MYYYYYYYFPYLYQPDFTLGKTHKSIFSRETSFGRLGEGEGVLPCDVSLSLKNIDFSQLIICCWLEFDMSLLEVKESKIVHPCGLGKKIDFWGF